MKFLSYTHEGRDSFGVLRDDQTISRLGAQYPTLLQLVRKDGWEAARKVVQAARVGDFKEAEIEYLPLYLEPVTIHCVGLNYAAHAAEAGHKPPEYPRTFVKIPAALVAHGQDFEKPTLSPEYDFEGEIAVVLSKDARNVKAKDAAQYIAGYTCFMDGSVRDYQFQRTLDQGKNFYRSSSIGPCLVTADEVGPLDKLTITTKVAGEVMQNAAFETMIFSIPKLIEYISAFTALSAGDVIATGTPEGVGFSRKPPRFLQSGEVVEVIVDRVGMLRNKVV
jgi:2-keto-4-pentenoate hydratase/2-oxohepta-3-ene-1,7-dioic acid hydratase in catechol pathway